MINQDLQKMYDFINENIVPLFDESINIDNLNIPDFSKNVIKEKRKFFDPTNIPVINEESEEEEYEEYVEFYASMIGSSLPGIFCNTLEESMCNDIENLAIRQAKFEFTGETIGKINNPFIEESKEYYLYISFENKMNSTTKFYRYSFYSKDYIEIKKSTYVDAEIERIFQKNTKAEITIFDENTVEIGMSFRPLYGYGLLYKVLNIGCGLLLIDPEDTWIS